MPENIRLTSSGHPLFTEAFALYGISFPEHERRTLKKQAALMGNPLYHFDAVQEAGRLLGILLHWEGSGYAYIEHFAIQPSLRGRAFGSGVLEIFCGAHPFVVLEIDPPIDEISVRRANFYQRLGFWKNEYAHLHPAYRPQFSPHELVVMSYPEPMEDKKYRVFRQELSDTVMKDSAL